MFMWEEDVYKFGLFMVDIEFVEFEEIVDVMFDFVVDEKLGDGIVYEVIKGKCCVVFVYNVDFLFGYGFKMFGYV